MRTLPDSPSMTLLSHDRLPLVLQFVKIRYQEVVLNDFQPPVAYRAAPVSLALIVGNAFATVDTRRAVPFCNKERVFADGLVTVINILSGCNKRFILSNKITGKKGLLLMYEIIPQTEEELLLIV